MTQTNNKKTKQKLLQAGSKGMSLLVHFQVRIGFGHEQQTTSLFLGALSLGLLQACLQPHQHVLYSLVRIAWIVVVVTPMDA